MFTVIGSTGFVGSHLTRYFQNHAIACFTPPRNSAQLFSQSLGHVIYCAGYTADFRNKIFEAVEAHVCLLRQILAHSVFDSLLYLSSTRVYQRASYTHEESAIEVDPHAFDHVYNISKLMGESLCLSTNNPNIRVARISNIYGKNMGSENFLGSIIQEALLKKKITLETSLDSCKDYIFIEDLIQLLVSIAIHGKKRVYNLASGYPVSNATLVKELMSLTGCSLNMSPTPATLRFPQINIERIKQEFDYNPTQLLTQLPQLCTKN